LVYYLRNDYYDEHFDMRNLERLCGKTIYFSGTYLKSLDPTLTNSFRIYGLLVQNKFDKAITLLQDLPKGSKGKIYQFVIDEMKRVVDGLSSDQQTQNEYNDFLQKWKSLNKKDEKIDKTNINFTELVEEQLKKVSNKQTGLDSTAQTKLFKDWLVEQKELFNQQNHFYKVEAKLKEIAKVLDKLEEQEDVLTFFDRRFKIVKTYNRKGFAQEFLGQIPIEKDEAEYKEMYETHFKPWPKFMNRPEHTLKVRPSTKYMRDSLHKLYHENKEKEQPSVAREVSQK
jgi:small subunit ribosomal protein S27